MGILGQQISIMANPLPGALKDLPHVADTGKWLQLSIIVWCSYGFQ
jgi:hypothetical protein